jgi:hypothetical protein
MQGLALQRCFNHAEREAAARCPSCRNFFCRECITEHDERVLCASCLRKTASSSASLHPLRATLAAVLPCLAGLFLAWFFFYLLGAGLLAIPAKWHNGSLIGSAFEEGD